MTLKAGQTTRKGAALVTPVRIGSTMNWGEGYIKQFVCIDVISYFIESQMSKDEQAK